MAEKLIEYPKTLDENLRFRYNLQIHCEGDPITAQLARITFANDILFAFNAIFYAYQPEHPLKDRPILTHPFQDDAILRINECIERGEHLFVDKSREMLATYMVILVFFWRFLTKPSEQYLLGSEKEIKVDRPGDMSSLFEKLRYQMQRLPFYLQPVGWNDKKHSTFMKMINPANGSAITGESTNRDFARSGRYSAILYDEFSTWDMAEEAWRSGSDATKCKIALGTPKGSGNKFAELHRTNEVKNKLHLIWWNNPEKAITGESYRERIKVKGDLREDQGNCPSGCFIDSRGKIRSEWYDRECEHRDPTDIAENLDCSYLTTGNPVFDTVICDLNLREMVRDPLKIGNLNWKIRPVFDENGMVMNLDALEVEFVPNINGMVKIWEEPEDGWENGYAIGADVAEGLEQGDYDSAFVLKRTETLKCVATLRTHIKTFEYAEELAKLAIYYCRACLAIERTGLGLSVVDQIFPLYHNLFYKQIMTKGYPERTDKIGWDTNSLTKPQIISNLSRAISQKEFNCPDKVFWQETLTFVNNDGKLEAQGKSRGERTYDDVVMSTAITLWVHNEIPPAIRKKFTPKLVGWRRTWGGNSNIKQRQLIGFGV